MPSRRELIRMTADEIHAYLQEQRRIIVVTIGAEVSPSTWITNTVELSDPEGTTFSAEASHQVISPPGFSSS